MSQLQVIPKQYYLSAIEMTTQRTFLPKQLILGPKRTLYKGTPKEANDLELLYDILRCNISFTHIERLDGMALSVWDDQEQAMCVLRKDGKFDSFGYVVNGKLYLHFYEALFLSELGRLQMIYNSMLLPLEKAYILFFDESTSSRYNEYLVYSYLSRTGCILEKYQNMRYVDDKQISKQDCVWELLHNTMRESNIPTFVESSKHFIIMKLRFEQIKIIFTDSLHVHLSQYISDDTQHLNFKKKIQYDNKYFDFYRSRQYREEQNHIPKSFLDILPYDVNFQRLIGVFKSFKVIHTSNSLPSKDNCRKLDISFDLYLHNVGYRKSILKPPMFRVSIVSSSDRFPTHEDVAKCYELQVHPLPILLVSIGESKQIHAFLFNFK